MTTETGDIDAHRHSRRATAQAVGIGITYMLPVFLAGALSTYVMDDLGLNRSQFGLCISAFFAASAVLMPASGMIVDRIGPRAAYRFSAVLSAVGLALIALVQTAAGLAAALAVAGAASAIGAPAASTLIVRVVPGALQARAFGLERAAIPFATLIAGLAVPSFAAFLPWRAVFVLASLAALSLVLARLPPVTPVRRARQLTGGHRAPSRRPLLLAAVAFALMSTSVSPLGTFLVDFAVTRGQTPALAGTLLALGSAAAIATRLLLGWRPPRGPAMRTVVVLMAIGSLGFLMLVPALDWTLTVGVLVAYGAGWGWTGVLSLAVVSAYIGSPGSATGIVQSGGAAGGIVGPVLVGTLADSWSYAHAWAAAALLAGLAAAVLLLEPATREGAW